MQTGAREYGAGGHLGLPASTALDYPSLPSRCEACPPSLPPCVQDEIGMAFHIAYRPLLKETLIELTSNRAFQDFIDWEIVEHKEQCHPPPTCSVITSSMRQRHRPCSLYTCAHAHLTHSYS